MKRSISSLLLVVIMFSLFSVQVGAAPVALLDINFQGGTFNETIKGSPWELERGAAIVDSSLKTNSGWAELDSSHISNINRLIDNDEDFYVDFGVSFESWDSDKHYIFHFDGSGADSFSVLYDKDYSANGTWRIRMTDASTPATYTHMNIDDNLALDQVYNVRVAREGNSIVIYREGSQVGSAVIPFSDAVATSDSDLYIGQDGQDGLWTLYNLTFFGEGSAASGSEEDVSLGISGDKLTFTPDSIVFSPVIIRNNVAVDSVSTTKININDERGTGEGFIVQASGSKFVSTPIADPSSKGNAQVTIGLPVTALNLKVGTVNTLSGQQSDSVYGPVGRDIILSSSSQTILVAEAGYGMGAYDIPLTYTLRVPKTGIIESIDGQDSKYQVGDSIGVAAATYWGRITYTIAAPL